MRTADAALKTEFALPAASLCKIVTITRRDGTIYRFTDIDTDIVVGAQTYLKSPGFETSSYTFNDKGQPVTGEIKIITADAGPIKTTELGVGLFDGATIQVSKVSFLNPGAGAMIEFTGFLGDIGFTDGGDGVAEMRSLTSRLGDVIIENFGPNCAANLGDDRCKVPILPADVLRNTAYVAAGTTRLRGDHVRVFQGGSYNDRIYECTTAGTTAGSAPAYTTTVDATTTDGTAVFTCRQAWTRFATIATIVNASRFTLTITEPRAVNGWFDNGALRFATGSNAGVSYDVRRWVQSSNTVELWTPTRAELLVGDTLYIHPGCDKVRTSAAGCAKFSNWRYFQGFDKMPGENFKFIYMGT